MELILNFFVLILSVFRLAVVLQLVVDVVFVVVVLLLLLLLC